MERDGVSDDMSFSIYERACPGCMFPDAPEGKWPHVKDSRCERVNRSDAVNGIRPLSEPPEWFARIYGEYLQSEDGRRRYPPKTNV